MIMIRRSETIEMLFPFLEGVGNEISNRRNK